jgi:hypothetical protein
VLFQLRIDAGVREKMFFTARFARDEQYAERKYVFFSAERAEKKRSTVGKQ